MSKGTNVVPGKFGFSPGDGDIDECIVEVANSLPKNQGETYDFFFIKVHSMANGDLNHKHFTERMLHLRGAKVIMMARDKIKGKGRLVNVYRLRMNADNERPRWNIKTSSE